MKRKITLKESANDFLTHTKNKKAITLIALVITIVVLIILSGVAINLTLGENGIFNHANQAKGKIKEAAAREKLELVLSEAGIEKINNPNYNETTFLNLFINERIQNVIIKKDIVNVDGYKFEIDRSIPKIKGISLEDEFTDIENYDNESLISKISKIKTSGYSTITVKGKNIENEIENVEYNVHTIVHNGNLTLDGKNNFEGATLNGNIYKVGDASTDVAKEGQEAQYTVALKVSGDLIINSGVTLTICSGSGEYGGPKGFIIIVTGDLICDGIICNNVGCYAEGQNVYLWKNKNSSYEYIPKDGGIGGDRTTYERNANWDLKEGNEGNKSDKARGTGGGGSGSVYACYSTGVSGAGANGTSYSGGAGRRR